MALEWVPPGCAGGGISAGSSLAVSCSGPVWSGIQSILLMRGKLGSTQLCKAATCGTGQTCKPLPLPSRNADATSQGHCAQPRGQNGKPVPHAIERKCHMNASR